MDWLKFAKRNKLKIYFLHYFHFNIVFFIKHQCCSINSPARKINKNVFIELFLNKEKFLPLQEKTEIPIIILIDNENKVIDNYQIKRFPTFLPLRADLNIHRVYDRFTSREERSLYQYLGFTFTFQKSSNSSSSGCDDGVCPPPAGY